MNNYVKVDPSIVNKICTEALELLEPMHEELMSYKEQEIAKRREYYDLRKQEIARNRAMLATEDERKDFDWELMDKTYSPLFYTYYSDALYGLVNSAKEIQFESSLAISPYLISPERIAFLQKLVNKDYPTNSLELLKERLEAPCDISDIIEICERALIKVRVVEKPKSRSFWN